MPFPKFFILFTTLLLTALVLPAQKASYADSYFKGYDIKIPGLIKNTIHVWSASSSGADGGKITLTLHIFSPEVHLISEKTLRLGWVKNWSMIFQNADTCYYANIFYEAREKKRQLLKIDQYGNFTDVSKMQAMWPDNFFVDEKNKFYASAGNKDNLYSVQTEHVPAGDSSATDGVMALPGENFTASSAFEKLTIRKLNRATRTWIELEYGSNNTRFFNPHIFVTDTALLVTATTPMVVRNPLLLVARFDTSLSNSGAHIALLKSMHVKESERYFALDHFTLNNNIVIISTGFYQSANIWSSSVIIQGGITRVFTYFVTNTLKFTLYDEKNRLLKDTIVEDKDGGSIQSGNSITFSTPGMVHFFCSNRYTNNKGGILHISFAADGTIEQQNMIVDPRFDYQLFSAKLLQPGRLLVPYNRHSKTGLMLLSY